MHAAAAVIEEIGRRAVARDGAGCHAQMYAGGVLLKHGNAASNVQAMAERVRLQAFGVTEPTSRSDDVSLRAAATPTAMAMSSARSCGPARRGAFDDVAAGWRQSQPWPANSIFSSICAQMKGDGCRHYSANRPMMNHAAANVVRTCGFPPTP